MGKDVPKFRHRSKSAPRAKSPDPKNLQQARTRKGKDSSEGFVTPPPSKKHSSPKESGTKDAKRRISFGQSQEVHHIKAENPPGPKRPSSGKADMDEAKASEIVDALKKDN